MDILENSKLIETVTNTLFFFVSQFKFLDKIIINSFLIYRNIQGSVCKLRPGTDTGWCGTFSCTEKHLAFLGIAD